MQELFKTLIDFIRRISSFGNKGLVFVPVKKD